MWKITPYLLTKFELFNLNRVIVNLLCYWHNCDFDRYRRVINLSLPKNKSGFNKFTLQMYNKNKFMKKIKQDILWVVDGHCHQRPVRDRGCCALSRCFKKIMAQFHHGRGEVSLSQSITFSRHRHYRNIC